MISKLKSRRVAALAAAALLLAAACGGNNDDAAPEPPAPTATSATTQQPTTVPTSEPTTPPEPTFTEAPAPIGETAPVSFHGFADGTLPELAIGEPVSGISGTFMDGTPFEWTPGSAPTVIAFLAHWCPACQNEVTELSHWVEQGNQLPAGVDFFSVSTLVNAERDNYPPSQWLKDEGWPIPVLLDDADSTLSEVFRLSGTPFWVVVSADGRLVFWDSGQIPPEDMGRLFNQLLAPLEG